jgi:predicted PurR-regulated permease PerM
MLLVWLAIASAAVGLGVLVALILGAVASISTAALWALLGAVVLFEGYRWMRRRRGSQLK